jgi:CRP/FNR family transcriptional regulator
MEKVATYLLQVRERTDVGHNPLNGAASNCQTILLEMTRTDIAAYLGLTIETVSRCLTKLKVRGLIKFVTLHTIELSEPDILIALAEGRIH